MLTNCLPSHGALGFNGSFISQWGNVPSNKVSRAAGLESMLVGNGREGKKRHVSLTHTYTVDEINVNLFELF